MALLKDYDLKCGDAIFTYSNSWLARNIYRISKHYVKKSKDRISHVAIFLKYDDKGNAVIAEALTSVVIREGTEYNGKNYDVHVASPNIIIDEEKSKLLYAYFKGKEGAGYAYIQIVALFFKRLLGLHKIGDWDKSSAICSELYVEAFRDLFNFDIFPGRQAGDVNPLEIYMSSNMTKKGER